MNNNMDNYLDSLQKGDTIEFEGDEYIFVKFNNKLNIIECENLETINNDDMYDDLEFGENNLYLKWLKEEEIDKQTNAGMELNK